MNRKDEMKPFKSTYRALLSVTDKSAIESLARSLVEMGWEILATEGTARYLAQKGVPVQSIDQILGYSQSLGHRVKTLDLRVLGGLLWNKADETHHADAAQLGLMSFDLLVSSFYPFAEVCRDKKMGKDELIEYIDVGGPTMLRAAAKNHASVIPLVDKDDYDRVIRALRGSRGKPEGVSLDYRRELAGTAFKALRAYDEPIVAFLENNR